MLPVFWKMRDLWPQANIQVFYCCTHKGQFLRNASFYSELLCHWKIQELDLLRFARIPTFVKRYLKKFILDTHLDSGDGIFKKVAVLDFFRRAIRFVSKLMVEWSLHVSAFQKALDSDIFFWSPRVGLSDEAKWVWKHLSLKGKPCIFYPHGPYYSAGSYRIPLPPNGKMATDKDLRPTDEIWYPHLADDVSISYPKNKERCFYSGYPGLDSEWLLFMRKSCRRELTSRDERFLRCLFLIRKFEDRPEHDWIFQTEEFISICREVVSGLRASEEKVELIVKPHPINDYTKTEEVFDSLEYPHWKITYNPVYQEVVNSDLVVSVPSTSNLIPIMYGLPVVHMDCSVMQTFYRWKGMKELYPANLQFYAPTKKQIANKVREAVRFSAKAKRSEEIPLMQISDLEHFRSQFPDCRLREIEQRLLSISRR